MNFDVCFCSSCSGKTTKVAFQVSQGIVARCVRCGRKHDKNFIAKFLAESKSERTLKIGPICQFKHETWHAFLTHSVLYSTVLLLLLLLLLL